ncbi:formylglycine-generating enzyme family protein [Fulvivirga sedimenti]|uniref:Formylglycine-generating enzyme family protein n=1 Tax=Fulvivirga sedimenti TaxID=2879465 RepID=A0A9X1HW86_9BACT|nr:SUMF1/EgtB/PvdO family nonheme iron enzyme [Fulvivirga sedimenti]MCA6078535.1 formylglycine-generating enzyme family protein [Fulvivirga sedimenti]
MRAGVPVVITLTALTFVGGGTLAVRNGFEDYNEIIPGTDLEIEMKAIEGGTFLAGSPDSEAGRRPDEGPLHEVRVDGFWMSTMEITWDEFEFFLYRNRDDVVHPRPGEIELDVDGVSGATMPYVNFNKPGHPVVNVTQYAASVFCEWLTARTGRFYRLPTEAEWEYASRAGTNTPYSFDDPSAIDEYAWYAENSNGTFNRGGMKEPNPWGLYDMHGNVAEWVLDSYDPEYYAGLPSVAENPLNRGEDLYPHVVRGGSWMDDPDVLRSAARTYSDPSWKKRDPQFPKSLWWHTDALHVGFRIVRPVQTPPESEWERFRLPPINDY